MLWNSLSHFNSIRDNNLPYISQNGSVPEGSLVQVLKQLDSLLDDPSMDKQMIYNRVQTAWDQVSS